jgi:hypothetical protein
MLDWPACNTEFRYIQIHAVVTLWKGQQLNRDNPHTKKQFIGVMLSYTTAVTVPVCWASER